ncbi:MAG: DUF421 domain-containing protein [Frisingicoccus sp.]|uniref:DUF421 domain-containing protein n=1 Tax=Frisingicoccus sp. TaxID=1918627 RepID=UPI002A82EB47|nr:DUF421 domain-containing protein [Frisingicoccus sp.]MDY4835765.1 DUF421 domain-containing protein [Frisingicoccus sp.]
MNILYIAALSLGSIVELLILCKFMGYRQLSQMSMFDYVNGITIGSIAAEMATSLEDNFFYPMTAMIIYAAAVIFLSWWSSKSIYVRRIVTGKPIVLLNNDKLYEKNFRKAKIDLNEFLTQCRVSGYFDLSQLESAILEENGRISFLPKSEHRPATPKDLQLVPGKDALVANIIIDGHVMTQNLKVSGKDERWLMHQLSAHGVSDVRDVFLATCDLNNQFNVYLRSPSDQAPDIFT